MAKATASTHYMTGPKKGQFKPGGTRKKTATRKPAAKRKPAARKRTYRRNPSRPDPIKMLTRGGITASQVLLGKAATRAIPDLAKLPQGGNTGLAVEVAVALALGYVTEMFFTKGTAAAVLAGGLTSPVERLIASAGIPYVSEYLTEPGVAGYVPRRRALAGYVPPSRPSTVGAYGRGGMGTDDEYPAMWQ